MTLHTQEKSVFIPFRRAFAAMLLGLVLGAPAAHADPADYCADSQSALQDALQRARTSPLNIQVVQGTYQISASQRIAAGANLRGGYTIRPRAYKFGASYDF